MLNMMGKLPTNLSFLRNSCVFRSLNTSHLPPILPTSRLLLLPKKPFLLSYRPISRRGPRRHPVIELALESIRPRRADGSIKWKNVININLIFLLMNMLIIQSFTVVCKEELEEEGWKEGDAVIPYMFIVKNKVLARDSRVDR